MDLMITEHNRMQCPSLALFWDQINGYVQYSFIIVHIWTKSEGLHVFLGGSLNENILNEVLCKLMLRIELM